MQAKPDATRAKVFVLRLVYHPTDEDLSAGTPVLAQFPLATPTAEKFITGSNGSAAKRGVPACPYLT